MRLSLGRRPVDLLVRLARILFLIGFCARTAVGSTHEKGENLAPKNNLLRVKILTCDSV